VGYAGFGGYGNFGFYGAVPMMHPPTTADLPPFPRSEYHKPATVPTGPAPMPPIPSAATPPAVPLPADAKQEEPKKGEPKKEEPKKEKERLRDDHPAPATVVLSVPARATVTVEGHVLQSAGSERTFHTPALVPGELYVYTVRATLVLGGREEVETRHVVVTAGETSRASFEKLFAKVERAAARSVAGAGQ
jgi:uncharacterized protein (TIGR03000 family)